MAQQSRISLNKLTLDSEGMTTLGGKYQFGNLLRLLFRKRLPLYLFVLLILAAVSLSVTLLIAMQSPDRCTGQAFLDYHPAESEYVKPMDLQALQSFLSVQGVLSEMETRARKSLNLSEEDFTINIAPNQTNRLVVTSAGKTTAEAMERVKNFADTAVALYLMDRQAQFRHRSNECQKSIQELDGQIEALRQESQMLNQKHHIVSLEKAIESMSQELSGKKGILNRATNDRDECMQSIQALEERMGDVSQEEMAVAKKVSGYRERITELEKAIDDLTMENDGDDQKLADLKKRLAEAQEGYRLFRSENNLPDDPNAKKLQKFQNLGDLYRKCTEGKELLQEAEKKVEEAKDDVRACEMTMEEYQKLQPLYDAVTLRIAKAQEKRDALEADKNAIDLLTFDGELIHLKNANVTNTGNLFSVLEIVLSMTVALVLTIILDGVLLFLDASYGKVTGVKELTFIPQLAVLGTVGGRKDNGERLFFRFKTAMGRRKTVFVGAMPGARRDDGVLKDFFVQCALCGLKLLVVEMVNAKTFQEPEGASIFAAVSYKGDRGWMPVVDTTCLSSSELLLLEADLRMLASDFDLVFLTCKQDFLGAGVLADQMDQLCDATLLLCGAGKTPRQLVRNFFRRTDRQSPDQTPRDPKPAMGVLTFDAAG